MPDPPAANPPPGSTPDPAAAADPDSRSGLPAGVWATAQTPAGPQRAGRYLPEATAHPAKMLPAIARHAIAAYSHPGELVLDPMCGIGTTLVEAVHLARDAVGVELEPRWAELARANLAHARAQGATGTGSVVTGDARELPRLLPAELRGRVALVLTSPPYGATVHGQVDARLGHGVRKWDDRYTTAAGGGRAGGNLALAGHGGLLAGIGDILAGCHALLRPGGLVVLTARPWRHRGALVDFPGALGELAERAGLVGFERTVALLCGLREGRLVPRVSFFQLDHVRKARRRGVPLRVIAHEDVLVFRRPESPADSRELNDPQRKPERAGGPGATPDTGRQRTGRQRRPAIPAAGAQEQEDRRCT